MLLLGATLRIIRDDLDEAVHGRNPLKKKCEWCKDLYNTNLNERQRKLIYGR